MLRKGEGGIVKVMTLEVKENFLQEVMCNMRQKGFVGLTQAKIEGEGGADYSISRVKVKCISSK
jgi:hypothetical protein